MATILGRLLEGQILCEDLISALVLGNKTVIMHLCCTLLAYLADK